MSKDIDLSKIKDADLVHLIGLLVAWIESVENKIDKLLWELSEKK